MSSQSRCAGPRRSAAWRFAATLVGIVGILLPCQSGAAILDECGSFFDLKPLLDASGLSEQDKLTIDALRAALPDGAATTGEQNVPTAVVYDFGSLFIALSPPIAADTSREGFDERAMIAATHVNGVNYVIKHAVRSPRFHFWSTISTSMTTSLTFYGESNLEIRFTGPPPGAIPDTVFVEVASPSAGLDVGPCGETPPEEQQR